MKLHMKLHMTLHMKLHMNYKSLTVCVKLTTVLTHATAASVPAFNNDVLKLAVRRALYMRMTILGDSAPLSLSLSFC